MKNFWCRFYLFSLTLCVCVYCQDAEAPVPLCKKQQQQVFLETCLSEVNKSLMYWACCGTNPICLDCVSMYYSLCCSFLSSLLSARIEEIRETHPCQSPTKLVYQTSYMDGSTSQAKKKLKILKRAEFRTSSRLPIKAMTWSSNSQMNIGWSKTSEPNEINSFR